MLGEHGHSRKGGFRCEFYTEQHKHYCGIDSRRAKHVCKRARRTGKGTGLEEYREHPHALRALIARCREDLAIAVECMFGWYIVGSDGPFKFPRIEEKGRLNFLSTAP